MEKAKNLVAACTIILSIWKRVTLGTKIGGPSGTSLSEFVEKVVLMYEEYLVNVKQQKRKSYKDDNDDDDEDNTQ